MVAESSRRIPSEHWRLADTLSVVEATLLILGIEPQGRAYSVERKAGELQPEGYQAVRQAIVSNLRSGRLQGKLVAYANENGLAGESSEDLRYDIPFCWVEVQSLIEWLKSRGVSTGYFFPENHGLQVAAGQEAPPLQSQACRRRRCLGGI